MNILSDTWYQMVRHLKTQYRMKIFIIVNIIQPMIWLLLFTQVFNRLEDMPQIRELGDVTYLQFFAPGVVVMTVIFGTAFSGFAMLRDMDMGILTKILATPASRMSVVLSRMLSSIVVLLFQAVIIFLAAIYLVDIYTEGLEVETGAPGILASLGFVILLGLGYAGLSNGLALLLGRVETLMAVTNFVALPTVFLSSAMMPGEALPGWLDTVRQFNPVDYTVVAVRSLVLEGYIWDDLWKSLAVLSAWAIAGVAFGTLMFRRYSE
ncbi:MAG: ABC transporter permease [Dehalococcoidia bacterium]